MGEGRTGQYGTEASNASGRTSVDGAARALGVTVDAIRKRVQRGTIPHERDDSGRVWVLLEAARTMQDESSTVPDKDQDDTGRLRRELLDAKEETIAELKDRVVSLERQMEAEREARRRADTIIARLTEANAALAERPRELAAPEEMLDAPETAPDTPEGAEPRSGTVESQTGARRPWWLRWLGG